LKRNISQISEKPLRLAEGKVSDAIIGVTDNRAVRYIGKAEENIEGGLRKNMFYEA